ncbi:MAG: sodium:solute symporter family protein [Bdellovibrionales bacterium]|nr:sodium:solute symporter family protein [Bdellovibrionales bacterium]
MTPEIFKYFVFGLFVVITYWLSFKGFKRARTFKGFSIGNKDLNPIVVGITMAASIASTATFVINPGFVYTHGLAAYMHYGVAALLGVLAAFLLISKRFRQIGDGQGSLTIPHWIYQRFGKRYFSYFFAFINLVSITFIVLILVGCSLLLSQSLPISQKTALVGILIFVFSYVLIGGTYAHVYTNTFQGLMMLFISLFLFFQGLDYFDGNFFGSLEMVSHEYASFMNSSSSLYFDFISVFLSGFVVTFALMLQPHILTKVLYLKEDKDINKFILTTFIVGFCFNLILFVGFYAKLAGLEVARQDAVVVSYINYIFSQSAFGEYFLTFVTVTLIAAGMSTLDGILVALSSMLVNDVYLPLSRDKDPNSIKSLRLSKIFLVLIGLVSLAIAWNPPQLVGLFAQKGVYALAAASVVPILGGVLLKRSFPVKLLFIASLIGFFGHLILNMVLGITNPAVSSTYAIGLSVAFLSMSALVIYIQSLKQKTPQLKIKGERE